MPLRQPDYAGSGVHGGTESIAAVKHTCAVACRGYDYQSMFWPHACWLSRIDVALARQECAALAWVH